MSTPRLKSDKNLLLPPHQHGVDNIVSSAEACDEKASIKVGEPLDGEALLRKRPGRIVLGVLRPSATHSPWGFVLSQSVASCSEAVVQRLEPDCLVTSIANRSCRMSQAHARYFIQEGDILEQINDFSCQDQSIAEIENMLALVEGPATLVFRNPTSDSPTVSQSILLRPHELMTEGPAVSPLKLQENGGRFIVSRECLEPPWTCLGIQPGECLVGVGESACLPGEMTVDEVHELATKSLQHSEYVSITTMRISSLRVQLAGRQDHIQAKSSMGRRWMISSLRVQLAGRQDHIQAKSSMGRRWMPRRMLKRDSAGAESLAASPLSSQSASIYQGLQRVSSWGRRSLSKSSQSSYLSGASSSQHSFSSRSKGSRGGETPATRQRRAALLELAAVGNTSILEGRRPDQISVTIYRSSPEESIGFTLEEDDIDMCVQVDAVHESGIIQSQGHDSSGNFPFIQVGDILEDVNGFSCRERLLSEVVNHLQGLTGEITMVFATRVENSEEAEEKILCQSVVFRNRQAAAGVTTEEERTSKGQPIISFFHRTEKNIVKEIDREVFFANSCLGVGDMLVAIGPTICHCAPLEEVSDLLDHHVRHSNPIVITTIRTSRSQKRWMAVRKSAVALGGGAMVGVGAVMMATPLHPVGHAMTIAGVGVLGTEFDAPKRAMNRARDRFRRTCPSRLAGEQSPT